jgi:hypothetical protein
MRPARAVWARDYACSFGKTPRDEARTKLLEHGFGEADPRELDEGGHRCVG